MRSIQEQTGWCVTIMVGGPLPSEKGCITTLVCTRLLFHARIESDQNISYHIGETKEGKDFQAHFGQDEFESQISSAYDGFLHEVFHEFLPVQYMNYS
jgi:hypothetical protein